MWLEVVSITTIFEVHHGKGVSELLGHDRILGGRHGRINESEGEKMPRRTHHDTHLTNQKSEQQSQPDVEVIGITAH
jgi:hypothetical protein